METDFDLIVIGGGTGANGVARMAASAGWKVASVDCLPSPHPTKECSPTQNCQE